MPLGILFYIRQMKTKITLIVLTLFTVGLFSVRAAEVRSDMFTKSLTKHPRLFMKAGEEIALLKTIQADSYWLSIHNRIIQESDSILRQPPLQRVKIGKRLLQTSRDVLHHVFFLSYAYRMTHDLRYAERAEQEMLSAADFSDWNPSHFLDVGEMMMAMGIGYDWLYDVLPENSRKAISESTLRLGLKESEKVKASWVKGDNNWNQVCHGGTVVAALAFGDEYPELCAFLVDRAIKNVPIALKAYVPDGAYAEGSGYWEYGTSYTAVMLDALESCFRDDFGLSRSKGFIPSALYAQQMITPTLSAFAYSDNGLSSSFSPTVFYFYLKTHDPRLLYFQRALFIKDQKKTVPSYARHRFSPFAILWGVRAGASLQNAEVPTQLYYVANGENPVAVMRSDWKNEKSTYLAIKGGSAYTNHAHMDAGSFYFESRGVKWAVDLGGENYNNIEKQGVNLWNRAQNSERWQVYRYNNFVHNTLTVNHKLFNVKGKAEWVDTCSQPMQMSVKADLTPVLSDAIRQAYRTCALVDKTVAVLKDEITVGEEQANITWNMMTEATQVLQVAPDIIQLTKGKEKLFLKVEVPYSFTLSSGPAKPQTDYENPNKGINFVRIDFAAPASSHFVLKVELLPQMPK